jgi:hypothetical protein
VQLTFFFMRKSGKSLLGGLRIVLIIVGAMAGA